MAEPVMDFQESLRRLLKQMGKEPQTQRVGPGRPAKVRAEVQPVLLHLYKDQVKWLDQYAAHLENLTEGNKRLSRVELVRGLLTALGEYAVRVGMTLPEGVRIRNEDELRQAVVEALERAKTPKRK